MLVIVGLLMAFIGSVGAATTDDWRRQARLMHVQVIGLLLVVIHYVS